MSLHTCVLQRLFAVGREDLLAALRPINWVVMDAVEAEITSPDQRVRLEALIAAGVVSRVDLEVGAEQLFTDLRGRMEDGEASALAWAIQQGATVASDERNAFHRVASKRLGAGRILTTPGLFVLAVNAGLLTDQEADRLKAELEARHHFKMNFTRSADLV